MFRIRSRVVGRAAATIVGLAACNTDQRSFPLEPALLSRSEAIGVFHRYVALGTSVSMGWQSDGVIAATQATSWPAQLAGLAGRELTQPYIAGTGCRSPLIAPLINGIRLSGEAALANPATLSCSPLRADVTLPVQNVAMNGALTQDALFTTPENTTDAANARLYSRVLQPGTTQVSTMMAENPKLVSVELGANEVLGALGGIAIPGVTLFPINTWRPLYAAVLDNIQKVTKMAVLVGLIQDVRTFPALRTGNELWADRAEFAGFNVQVSADCQGSDNLVFVTIRVPLAVQAGAAYLKAGLGPYPFSCAAGAPTTPDYVLSPTEAPIVNAQMRAMSANIQAEAAARGYAHFDLGALYDRTDIKGPFSVVALVTSGAPFGPYFSLDGVHPSAQGARILAEAAARALNTTYRLGIPEQ